MFVKKQYLILFLVFSLCMLFMCGYLTIQVIKEQDYTKQLGNQFDQCADVIKQMMQKQHNPIPNHVTSKDNEYYL